jgi:hypothetical protein
MSGLLSAKFSEQHSLSLMTKGRRSFLSKFVIFVKGDQHYLRRESHNRFVTSG